MKKLILMMLLGLIFSPQYTLADSSEPNNIYSAVRIVHGANILLQHGDNLYEVYAIGCNENVHMSKNLRNIILLPGEPVELFYILKYTNTSHILILYSLPCN